MSIYGHTYVRWMQESYTERARDVHAGERARPSLGTKKAWAHVTTFDYACYHKEGMLLLLTAHVTTFDYATKKALAHVTTKKCYDYEMTAQEVRAHENLGYCLLPVALSCWLWRRQEEGAQGQHGGGGGRWVEYLKLLGSARGGRCCHFTCNLLRRLSSDLRADQGP